MTGTLREYGRRRVTPIGGEAAVALSGAVVAAPLAIGRTTAGPAGPDTPAACTLTR
jgi:hypothetical protein